MQFGIRETRIGLGEWEFAGKPPGGAEDCLLEMTLTMFSG
jgi:hypothetical protein